MSLLDRGPDGKFLDWLSAPSAWIPEMVSECVMDDRCIISYDEPFTNCPCWKSREEQVNCIDAGHACPTCNQVECPACSNPWHLQHGGEREK